MPRDEGTNITLSPDYVVGFVDGEGCFCVPITKHQTLVHRKEVRPTFEIELREDDRHILEAIQRVLGCGKIYHLRFHRYHKWRPHVKLKVSKMSELQNLLIPFFDIHPLKAKKRKSFLFFKQIVSMVARKEHLTSKGLQKIMQIRNRMNP